MGLTELFLAVMVAGVSCINVALPVAAWRRSSDGRFLAVVGANAVLAVLGAVWAWGELPLGPPAWTAVSWPILGLALLVSVLFLVSALWPRST